MKKILSLCAALTVALAHAQTTPSSSLSSAIPSTSAASDIATAQTLLQSNKPKEAYALLEPQEEKWAGQSEFDYAFGVVAAAVQEDTRAIFALERLLEVNPKHLQGRLLLAQLYFKLGENTTAKNAFLAIQPLVPPQVGQSIDLYLQKLGQRDKRPQEGWSGDVQAIYGHDDNINSATAQSSIAIPLFNNAVFQLSSNAQKTADDYFSVLANARYRKNLSARCAASAYGAFGEKVFGQHKEVNQNFWDWDLSVSCNPAARHQWVLGYSGQQFLVNHQMTRVLQGALVQWNWQTVDSGQWSQTAQFLRINFPTIHERNARRVGLATTWTQSFDSTQSTQVFAGLQWARERTDDPLQNVAGYRDWGLKAGATKALNPKTVITGVWTGDTRTHLQSDTNFLKLRNDHDHSLQLGVEHTPVKRVTYGLKWVAQNNHSNIDLYNFQKRLWQLSWRWAY